MFSEKQRKAILLRDNNKCQAPFKHNCRGRLEVHHIIPQHYARTILGLTEEETDKPENALTICLNAHRIIHPDLDQILIHYHELVDRGMVPFRQLEDARGETLKQKKVYWDTQYDRLMLTLAFKRTAYAKRDNWEFPIKKTKSVKAPTN